MLFHNARDDAAYHATKALALCVLCESRERLIERRGEHYYLTVESGSLWQSLGSIKGVDRERPVC